MLFVFFVSYHNYQVAETQHNQLLKEYDALKEKIEEQRKLNERLLEVIESETIRGYDVPQTGQRTGDESQGTR
ncbi:heat-shock protein Hsp70 [Thermotoga sp. SG1]|nr:heat-shock protein Hsp70 [Thermotoga sp. SG1]